MRIVLLGGPGVGKGTQAAVLKERLNVPHISTGEIFRENISKGTPLGLAAKEYVENGGLVPDSITVGMVKERLQKDDCRNGYILDGFPRTVPQAEAFEEVLKTKGPDIDAVLSFELADDEIVKRLSGRRVCPACGAIYHVEYGPYDRDGACVKCGEKLIRRKDDEENTIRERLGYYHKETAPLLEFYTARGKLRAISAAGSIEEVFSRVLEALALGGN